MFSKFRKSAAIALTSVAALSMMVGASAQSSGKTLSSNFTLVNLFDGANKVQITYYKEDGSLWRTEAEPEFTMNGLGDLAERKQYDDTKLPGGSGSVVVSTQQPVGAVVQIQARNQVATSGAYIGVNQGSDEVNVPLVMRQRGTASGEANSQLIIQNASGTPINFEVDFFDGVSGAQINAATFTKSNLAANASFEYDLHDEGNLPTGWYGSAVVKSTTSGGQIAVVTNLFNGEHTLQTINGFTSPGTKWGIPLFASRLGNGLNTPLVIQNVSGQTIPKDAITLNCTKSAASPGPATVTVKNEIAIPNKAAYFNLNPVPGNPLTNQFPDAWYGPCTVDTGSFNTALFVQMRVVGKEADGNFRAGAYEGIRLDGTNKRLVVPLYARRLANGFVSNVTIQNLSTSQDAHITLNYKGKTGYPANCTVSYSKTIPPNGSQLENHRVTDDVDNSTPQIGLNCYGSLTVTSDQPIDGFVQLDQLDDAQFNNLTPGATSGDRFMAHAVFLLP